jgi:hypothetical protein
MNPPRKTVQLTPETWTQLNEIKYKSGHKTIEEVIKSLLAK